MKASCKKCGGHVSYDPDQYAGKVVDCPHCNVKLRLPAATQKQKQESSTKPNSGPHRSAAPHSEPTSFDNQASGNDRSKFSWVALAGVAILISTLFKYFSTHDWHTLIPASFKEVQMDGTLYVKLNSGDSVPLSMVKVAVYEEGFISNKMATINAMIMEGKRNLPAKTKVYEQRKTEMEAIEKKSQKMAGLKSEVASWWQQYQSSKSSYAYQSWQRALADYQRESANGSGEVISQSYKDSIKDPVDLLENEAKLKVVLDLKVLSLANDEPIWGGAVATALTDKDGKFHIALPQGGDYALFAVTSRRSLAGQERFVFFRRLLLKSGYSYPTVDLNNQHEEVSEYTTGWPNEMRNEESDLKLLKDVLFWLMKGNYGLEDVNPASQH